MEVAVAVAVRSAIVAAKRAISLGLAQMRPEVEMAMEEVEVVVVVEVMVASAAAVREPGDIHFQYFLSDNVMLMNARSYTCGGVGHLSRDCVQGSKCYNCSGVVSIFVLYAYLADGLVTGPHQQGLPSAAKASLLQLRV